MAAAMWDLKWELGIPVILLGGIGTGLTSIDEGAGLVALYMVVIEFFVYRDLSLEEGPRPHREGVDEPRRRDHPDPGDGERADELRRRPARADEGARVHAGVGIEHKWQFLIVMNMFLLVLGMLMEGFSAILVAVPLILPFVADLGMRHPDEKMSPFQLAMIFLLNLEIAYCMPPLGLNLFIASFRFNRPVSSLYRVVLPFVGILAFGTRPRELRALVQQRARWRRRRARRATKAEKDGVAPARRVDDGVRPGGPDESAAVHRGGA